MEAPGPEWVMQNQNQYIATLIDILEKHVAEAHAREIAAQTERRMAELEARLQNLEARLQKK